MLDCFVGFYLTLPARRAERAERPPSVRRQRGKSWWERWSPAWRIKTSGCLYRVNFDVHRAFELWTWGLLFILAFTAFSLNLYREVFYPLMSMVSVVTSTPFNERKPVDKNNPIEPVISYSDILARARDEGSKRGWREPVGAISYSPNFGIYQARYFFPGKDHGTAGVGPTRLYFDSMDGMLLGERVPWSGTAADIFVQAQFPLHSGRILGLPGRILISVMGRSGDLDHRRRRLVEKAPRQSCTPPQRAVRTRYACGVRWIPVRRESCADGNGERSDPLHAGGAPARSSRHRAKPMIEVVNLKGWCPGLELNQRHRDFQSRALPTELPGHCSARRSLGVRARPL